jgi:hypothetical protein
LILTTIAGLAMVLALNPCDIIPETGGASGTKKGGEAMNPSLAHSKTASPRPAMDLAAPARIETATFALG